MDFATNKKWSDGFLPEIKSILGQHLIGEASPHEDQEHNTDLLVLKLDTVRIACRIRKYKYLGTYGDQFTIRAGRKSGNKTELAKVIEGWGDYIFYGFANESETKLVKWFLGDLNVFRLWFVRRLQIQGGVTPGAELYNKDGSSIFRSFSRLELPNEFIVAEGYA